jgi:hypothetical protein
VHVTYVKTAFGKFTYQTPRPRWRDAYNVLAKALAGCSESPIQSGEGRCLNRPFRHSRPRAQGAARWTQARIGAALGVAQPTVALWFAATSNISVDKASKPPKPKDKRVKVAWGLGSKLPKRRAL